MSYNGKLDFGLLGDYDAMPDIDELAEAFAESLQEMVEVARRRTAGRLPPPSRRRADRRRSVAGRLQRKPNQRGERCSGARRCAS